MLMSRQGVGGGRAHTQHRRGACRAGSWIMMFRPPRGGVFPRPGAGGHTTFCHPGAWAEIDKEVAV